MYIRSPTSTARIRFLQSVTVQSASATRCALPSFSIHRTCPVLHTARMSQRKTVWHAAAAWSIARPVLQSSDRSSVQRTARLPIRSRNFRMRQSGDRRSGARITATRTRSTAMRPVQLRVRPPVRHTFRYRVM